MKRFVATAVIFCLALGAQLKAADSITCAPVDGMQQVLHAPGVFIGDMHGTEQSPAFLRDLACHVLSSGQSLVVALEYSSGDQPVLDQFLQMHDERAAAAFLTDTPYWQNKLQDGRTSMAMRDALLAIRRYALAGGKVQLVAYDTPVASVARESKSAKLVSQKRLHERAKKYWIVFGGNVHARKTRGLEARGAPAGYENYEPLGYLIRDWRLIHLDVRYQGGSAWICTDGTPEGCRARILGPPCPQGCVSRTAIRLDKSNPAYDGVYDVGALSASLAVHQ